MSKKAGALSERFRTVWFMALITFVSISIVASIHLATADIVERNATLFMKRAVAEAAGLPPFAEAASLLEWYDASVKPTPAGGTPDYYLVQDEARGISNARVFVRTGAGLWGPIRAVAGLSADLSTFTGVTFVDQNETPGLGARISEAWFREQFKGKTGPLRAVPEHTRSASPEEFDAITGATITTTAVRDILNELAAEARGRTAAAAAGGN